MPYFSEVLSPSFRFCLDWGPQSGGLVVTVAIAVLFCPVLSLRLLRKLGELSAAWMASPSLCLTGLSWCQTVTCMIQ